MSKRINLIVTFIIRENERKWAEKADIPFLVMMVVSLKIISTDKQME
jgi:hypothetical protein